MQILLLNTYLFAQILQVQCRDRSAASSLQQVSLGATFRDSFLLWRLFFCIPTSARLVSVVRSHSPCLEISLGSGSITFPSGLLGKSEHAGPGWQLPSQDPPPCTLSPHGVPIVSTRNDDSVAFSFPFLFEWSHPDFESRWSSFIFLSRENGRCRTFPKKKSRTVSASNVASPFFFQTLRMEWQKNVRAHAWNDLFIYYKHVFWKRNFGPFSPESPISESFSNLWFYWKRLALTDFSHLTFPRKSTHP